jgi:cell division protein FtsL
MDIAYINNEAKKLYREVNSIRKGFKDVEKEMMMMIIMMMIIIIIIIILLMLNLH